MEINTDLKKKRVFRKFSFRGIELDQLLDLTEEDFSKLLDSRGRRKLRRGLLSKRKVTHFLQKIKKSKANCSPVEKPKAVRTHMRDMLIVPEMIGAIISVYTGRVFANVEVKADMVGHMLGEFAITYKPVSHGRPGLTPEAGSTAVAAPTPVATK